MNLKYITGLFFIGITFFISRYLCWKLSDIADFFTIIGTAFALIIYYRWTKDYRVQKAHEYCLDILKKVKLLHNSIEVLRAPKFYPSKDEKLLDYIEKVDIPRIEKIISDTIIISTDLLIAEDVLLHDKQLLDLFNEKIADEIIKKIREAVYALAFAKNDGDDIKTTLFWEIVYPLEHNLEVSFKNSTLGINTEVIDDTFNQKIEKNFNFIYEKLRKNMQLV